MVSHEQRRSMPWFIVLLFLILDGRVDKTTVALMNHHTDLLLHELPYDNLEAMHTFRRASCFTIAGYGISFGMGPMLDSIFALVRICV